jgi:phenylpropionate dioxygenase-like ring-hydroxylating dioxygenase large terminal subunit
MSIHKSPDAAAPASREPPRRGFLPDAEVAARVLAHVRERSTDVGCEVWREPVQNYRSPERWARELELVLRRWPVPFCPSAALPEPGCWVAREAAGTPLVVVRGEDGRARAFRNACRHRGTQLAEGSGCARSFVCRYHGWTYGLDGSLRHVPHEHGFPGLDKRELGLAPVACEERLGLVFVTQESDAAGAESALDDLPALIAPEQRLLASGDNEVPVNWKIFLEGFIEGYHIRSTHPKSFYPFGYDNLNVVERCGPNSRVTYPFRRIEALAEVAPEARRVDGLLTYVYHLFPNALVTVLSHHTNLVVLEPVAVDRTRLVTYGLTNRGADAADTEAAKRDAAFVNQTGAAEDLAIVMAIQRSLASEANQFFTFGHFESAIAHFHGRLDAVLASA